jgi:hypothetical protein
VLQAITYNPESLAMTQGDTVIPLCQRRIGKTVYNAPMTLTLDLNPDLERRLRAEAASRGLTLEELILEDLNARAAQVLNPSRLNPEETALMQVITEGLPEAFWARYRELITLRDQEALSEAEHAELIDCSDRVEQLSARRVEALVQLAQLRRVSVQTLRAELGLQPVPIAA